MAQSQDLPRLKTHWLHSSGGLVWHLRALRYRNTLWQPFRLTVGDWLRNWQPPVDKLVLVGPSAGYTLNQEFLQRWQAVLALEPDPLARWLLRKRYREVRWRFEDADVLGGTGSLAQSFAGHAMLFVNVLGQIAPRDAADATRWRLALRERLAGMHWASYHDVISTQRAPDETVTQQSSAATLDELLSHFWRGGELEIVEHGSFGLGQPGHYCIWPLRPGHYHLVEWLTGGPLRAE
jgi:hypothetical protein